MPQMKLSPILSRSLEAWLALRSVSGQRSSHSIRGAVALVAALSGGWGCSDGSTSGPEEPPVPVQLVVVTQPDGASSGSPLTTQPAVELRDAQNRRVSNTTLPVSVAIATGSGGLVGTTTVTSADGVARFQDLRIDGSGAHVLTFSAPGLPAALSTPLAVNQTASALVITQQPTAARSGEVFSSQPILELRDPAGLRVTGAIRPVSVSIGSGSGSLRGTTTVTPVDGVVTFVGLSIVGVGSHTLSFRSESPALQAVGSPLIVSPGDPVALFLVTPPGEGKSGQPLTRQPVVELRDATGNRTTSTAQVRARIARGSGSLVGTVTVEARDGAARFTDLQVNGPGVHVLSFEVAGIPTIQSDEFPVSQLAAALRLTAQPASGLSGVAFATQPVVQIVDHAGLPVTAGADAQLTIQVARGLGTGTLTGQASVTARDGVASFSGLAIEGSGSHTLRFTTSLPPLEVVSNAFTVTVPSASQLAIRTQPGALVTSGEAWGEQPVVEVRDATGRLVASAAVAVTATLVGSGGILGGATTVQSVNGVAAFTDLRISGAGSFRLVFSSQGLTSVTSTIVNVTQLPTSLGVVTQPSGAVTGTPFSVQPVVHIRDGAGATVTSGSGSGLAVTASIASGSGTLSGPTTVSAVNGVATFQGLAITGEGPHRLIFRSESTELEAQSALFPVAGSASGSLSISVQPSGSVSGLPLTSQPVIEVRDANGGLVTTPVQVTASLSAGDGTSLSGTTTVTSVNGVATFGTLRVQGAGTTVFLTFAASGFAPATSSPFAVTQQAASLAIQVQPAGAASGVAFSTQPVVRILDHAGLLVTTGPGATLGVGVSVASGSGSLSGLTPVTAVSGVAAFQGLAITGNGSHTLTFSTASPGLNVISSAFTVTSADGGIRLLVGSASTATVASGAALAVPLIVDLSDRGGDNLASITVVVAWDPAKFEYVSNTAGSWTDSEGGGASVTVNATEAAAGSFRITGFTPGATFETFTLRTLNLKSLAPGTWAIGASVPAAGNELGASVGVGVRGLSVTVTDGS